MSNTAVYESSVLVFSLTVIRSETLLSYSFSFFGQLLKLPQKDDESHQQKCLKHHEHKETHLKSNFQVTVPVVTRIKELLLCDEDHQPPSEGRRRAAVHIQVGLLTRVLASQPVSQVEDPVVTHPGVTIKSERVDGGQIIQKPFGEGSQHVVMEKELGRPGGKSGGQREGSERPAAAINPDAMTEARVRAL